MINLDFELSPSWKAIAANRNLREASRSDLAYTLFLGDIVFECGPADFSARWGWVPVLDFAFNIYSISRDIWREPEQFFEFTESEARLHFSLQGSRVHITATYASEACSVPCSELTDSARRFAYYVFSSLAEEFPELEHSPEFQDLRSELLR